MNTKLKYIALAAAAITSVGGFTGCEDVLDEQPRGTFEPSSFGTEQGIQGGLTGFYQNLRNLYGNMYFYNSLETGTDEYTYGESADGNFKDADLSGAGTLTPSSCRSDALWGNAFTAINSANLLIKSGEESGVAASMIAEAYFFRAFNYFCLVQTFGGVPLDLGSGKLEPNIAASRTSVRNTVPEVYQVIFQDLNKAVSDLPEKSRKTGTVTKTVARFFLAKAYLTFGWWLENPNNIPTYPDCNRADLDGHDAAWYYNEAYTVAKTAIDNPGSYGLMDTYYDVNLGANDRNKECLLYADHTEEDEYYNGGAFGYANGSATDQVSVWAVTWNYCNIHCADDFAPCVRAEVQWGGRPWTRMAPSHEVFHVFTDKDKDSRYDGTFVTVYRGNWDKAGQKPDAHKNANGMDVKPGEPVLTFVSEQLSGTVTYPTEKKGKNNVCAGETEGRADWVVEPDHVSRNTYPGLWKLGSYNSKVGDGIGQPNGSLRRPFVIAKFSELYLIAAEAAVKAGKNAEARDMINVLRARAGKWRFSNAENQIVSADYSAELTAATPATIDINYILDERMRELYGEGIRWYDLVRTQTWAERAGSYTICVKNSKEAWIEKQTFTRDIKPFNYLRPIPVGQLNAMEITDAERAAYQNPGYN
ncbi:MAG: RagB/SusD family nutrient uptake outer membrane protein [Bacteroidales bacterium]|nr:RagB/SusD family nutrient uptake outer membrane protein [Bacteroidales bacterium]